MGSMCESCVRSSGSVSSSADAPTRCEVGWWKAWVRSMSPTFVLLWRSTAEVLRPSVLRVRATGQISRQISNVRVSNEQKVGLRRRAARQKASGKFRIW